jgi:glyoxylate/hydroxypyruvate reductase
MSAPDTLHIHFDSRRTADPVFHLTKDLCAAALARRPDLADRVGMTFGWDLEGVEGPLATADMLVGFRMPKDLIRTGAPRLRNIHLIGAGVEHLRPLDWVPPQVAITNNRGVHKQKAGEFIVLALLMLNNYVPALVTAQRSRVWNPLFSTSVVGKTVLIFGAGRLGSAGAQAARKLGFHVIGIRRSGGPNPDCDETYGPDRLHEMLPRADFVLVTAPATRETEGLFGDREYGLMRKGAGFINFGRAKVCDYDALTRHLDSGHLSGAILDVFDPEPLPSDSPLWQVNNLIITPHCSSDDAIEYIPITLDLVMENASRMLAGQALTNVVNTELEY